MKNNKFLLAAMAFVATIFICNLNAPQKPIEVKPPAIILPLPDPTPELPKISTIIPGHLSYDKTIEQLNKWHYEAPDLTEVGVYGKSSAGKDLYYIRLTNKFKKQNKPKILISACIHGNEQLSSSVMMATIGSILNDYANNKEMLDNEDLYFIPIVSPDSYNRSRAVDGVDPNRDFPTLNNPNKVSIPPIECLKKFILEHKFKAFISGHTSGRQFLYPYGDLEENCPNYDDYMKILKPMAEMSGYDLVKDSELYGHIIKGSESDWAYRQKCLTIVIEFGTIQRPATMEEVKIEFNKTYKSILYFIKEAPLVEIK